MENRRSVKQTLARRMVLVAALNDSRARADDGSPVINADRLRSYSSPVKRAKSETDISNCALNEVFSASLRNPLEDGDEPYTAVGSHEDIRQIGEVSVKKILENFKNLECNESESNSVSFIKPPKNRFSKINEIVKTFEIIDTPDKKPEEIVRSLTCGAIVDRESDEIILETENLPKFKIDNHFEDNDMGNSDIVDPRTEIEKRFTVENMSEWDFIHEASLVKNSIFLQNDNEGTIDNSDNENYDHSDTEDDLDTSGNEVTLESIKKNPAEVVARKLYSIVTEILTTERSYVKKLYLLDVLFQKELLKLAAEQNSIPESVIIEIFSNLTSIHQFHSTLLLPDLEKRIEDWDDNPKIGDIFKTLGHCLKMYTEFVKNFDHGTSVLNHWLKKCHKFSVVVEEIQKKPESENLALQHHLLGPIQRIPRYKLLLQDYLNKLPEDSPDREETEASLEVISEAAAHANNSMKENEMFKKLLEIEDRVSDGLNGQTLVTPSRVFIKEGEIKKQAARSDHTMPRTLLLFNDLLLCCSVTTTGKFNVRQIMDVAGITIEIEDLTIPEHGFRVKSRQRVLDLITNDDNERNEWITAIKNTVDELEAKRGMAMKKILEEDAKLNKTRVGEKAPVWVKDEDVTMCMICALKFGMVQRKHHCRGCGRVVCDKCSNYRTRLAYLGDELKRVCCACSLKITGKSQIDMLPQVQASIRTRNNKVTSDFFGQVIWKAPGKDWKMQWVTLSEFVLYIQKKRQDVKSSFTLPVPGFEISQCPPSDAPDSAHPFCLKLHKGNKKEHTYHIATDKEENFTRWLNHLRSAVQLKKLESQSL